jgi:hypothetical protein
VWGNIIDADGTTVFVVHWSPGHLASHAAAFGLVFGPWGEGSSPADRMHVALDYRRVGAVLRRTVVDAETSPIDARPLADTRLSVADVTARGLTARVWRYFDQIWLRDSRIAELRSM